MLKVRLRDEMSKVYTVDKVVLYLNIFLTVFGNISLYFHYQLKVVIIKHQLRLI